MRSAGQAMAGLGHQALVGGITVALTQAERTGDFDEEQAAGLLARQRLGEQSHHMVARRQAGFRIAAHADLFAGLLQRLLARAANAVGHCGDQVARADRLGQEIVGAAVEHFELALRIRVAGQEHDRQQLLAGLLADQGGQADAVQLGHVQIHQDQIRVVVLDRLRHAGGGHFHLRMHAGTVQHALCEQGLRAVVLDDQYAIWRICRHAAVAFAGCRLCGGWRCCRRGARGADRGHRLRLSSRRGRAGRSHARRCGNDCRTHLRGAVGGSSGLVGPTAPVVGRRRFRAQQTIARGGVVTGERNRISGGHRYSLQSR